MNSASTTWESPANEHKPSELFLTPAQMSTLQHCQLPAPQNHGCAFTAVRAANPQDLPALLHYLRAVTNSIPSWDSYVHWTNVARPMPEQIVPIYPSESHLPAFHRLLAQAQTSLVPASGWPPRPRGFAPSGVSKPLPPLLLSAWISPGSSSCTGATAVATAGVVHPQQFHGGPRDCSLLRPSDVGGGSAVMVATYADDALVRRAPEGAAPSI
jgi:hypothetical protein